MEERNPHHRPDTCSTDSELHVFIDKGGIPPGSPEFLERDRLGRLARARRLGADPAPEPPAEPPPAE